MIDDVSYDIFHDHLSNALERNLPFVDQVIKLIKQVSKPLFYFKIYFISVFKTSLHFFVFKIPSFLFLSFLHLCVFNIPSCLCI